ncbi:pentatricopeptide repeat-containing protein At5g64320, mitochondrial-like [Pistacia vera]|uniref:pentatricopeptide repeat-containing protein At5g64320, mitochondrial-like n=1 Tax=Pistacia vera TaxID=55513 RepID=UPI001263E5F4|nr:pentatricopeptide repeat-containing protein At5g64320, mitochondrial-like [Pistacia vera]
MDVTVGSSNAQIRDGVSDSFAVLGGILKKGFSPDAVTFNCLIKGLCVEFKIMESMELFTKMVAVRCRPTVITCNTLIDGLCKTGKMSVAIKLCEEMAKGNEESGNGLIEKARELYMEMKGLGISPDVYTYTILMNGYCLVDRIGDARELFDSEQNPAKVHLAAQMLYFGYMEVAALQAAVAFAHEVGLKGLRIISGANFSKQKFYARACALSTIVDEDKARRALEKVFNYNVLKNLDAEWGQSSVETVDMVTLQSREISCGVRYAVAVTMTCGDLFDMGFQIAIEIYEAEWSENGHG